LQVTTQERHFPSYFKKTFAAALGIEILCITSAEIGENLGLLYFGFNTIGIAIAIALGFAFAGFTTFVTILGKSHGKHIHGCCSVLETDNTPSFFKNLKTTFLDFGKGIKKLSRFHKEPESKHILKESVYILITAECGCIIVAEIVALLLYQHSLFLSFPVALLAGTVMIVITTFDKRTRYFIPVLVLILISMPFIMTNAYGSGLHFHTFTGFEPAPDPSKQSLFQNVTFAQAWVHGNHVHPGYTSGITSEMDSIESRETLIINGKSYSLDIVILAGSSRLDVPREFSFKLIDDATGQIEKNVTYQFSLKQQGKALFEETFQRENGYLFVKIIPETPFKIFFEDEIRINRSSESLPGLDGKLEVFRGPILDSAGVYEISLEILTAGTFSNQIDPPATHNGFLTLSDVQNHEISDSKFGKQVIITNNYFGEIQNFQYLEEENQLKFNLSHNFAEVESNLIPDLKMHLLVPKTFSPFLAKDMSVFINEKIILNEYFIQVQDMDENTKLLTFVVPAQGVVDLSKDPDIEEIEFVISPTHPDGFPISLLTKDRNYDILLAWDPTNISAGNELDLLILANDLSYSPKQLDYELILLQNNEEFLIINSKTSNTNPPQPTTLTIPEEIKGLAKLKLTFNGNSQTQTVIPIFINDN
jgi:hypothetical protein